MLSHSLTPSHPPTHSLTQSLNHSLSLSPTHSLTLPLNHPLLTMRVSEVLLGVVEDLAFATMFETGKLTPLNLKPIHIVSMLSEVLEAAYATDERGSIKDFLRLSIRCSRKVPQVVCADSSLQRILFNLVSNAMQHCAEKGEVSLSVHYSHSKPPPSIGPPQITYSKYCIYDEHILVNLIAFF